MSSQLPQDSPEVERTSFKSEFQIIGLKEDSFIESYVAEVVAGTENRDFFAVLEIFNSDVDLDHVADALIETFRKHFYESEIQDPYTRFEESLKFVNDVARDFQSNGLPLHQLNMAIAALVDDHLYLSQANDAEVYLLRGGIVTNISEGLSVGKRKEHSDLFENIATGNLEKNDIVLFSTSRLMRYVTQSVLYRFFQPKNVKEGLTELSDSIKNDVLGRVGVLGVKFEEVFHPNAIKSSLLDLEIEQVDNKFKAKLLLVKRYSQISFNFLKETTLEFVSFVNKFFAGKNVKLDNFRHKKAILISAGVSFGIFIFLLLFLTGLLESPTTKNNRELVVQAASIVSSAKSEEDKNRAAQLLISAESKLTEASNSSGLRGEIEEVQNEISTTRSLLDNLLVISEPQVFADISSKRSTVNLLGLQKIANAYYAFDNERIFEFIGSLVKDPINLIDSTGTLIAASSFSDVESVVFLLKNDKLKEISGGVVKYMDTDDEIYKPGIDIFSYGSRVYILDNTVGQLWKYQRKRDSYAKSEPSLNNIDTEKVKSAVAVAIDGSVYLLYKNGEIEKYYAGSKENAFEIETPPLTKIENATDIYTEFDFPYVLVLDGTAKTVYQYYKNPRTDNLKYIRQYYFEDLDKITGFMVDYSNKRLLVSDEQKVYATEFRD
jgi:hypothetical protein